MSNVYHFIAEVNTLLDEQMLDLKLTRELFGRTFRAWMEQLDGVDHRCHPHDESEDSRQNAYWFTSHVHPIMRYLLEESA